MRLVANRLVDLCGYERSIAIRERADPRRDVHSGEEAA
jgi:hypothetical protein